MVACDVQLNDSFVECYILKGWRACKCRIVMKDKHSSGGTFWGFLILDKLN